MSALKNKITTLVSGILIGGVILTSGFVFANSSVARNASNSKEQPATKINKIQMNDEFKTFIEGLVTDGTISQEAADKILAFMEEKNMNMKRPMMGKPQGPGAMKLNTESLVSGGIITQEQADAISAYFEQKQAEKKEEMEKVKSMTDEERKAYFESLKEQKTQKEDLLSELVNAGIITQEQADAIKEQMKPQDKPQAGTKKATESTEQ